MPGHSSAAPGRLRHSSTREAAALRKGAAACHFYGGDPLRLLQIEPKTGTLSEVVIGGEIIITKNKKSSSSPSQQKLQHIASAGGWFASTSFGEYSLVGCTVSPGFEFADFEMGSKKELQQQCPSMRRFSNSFAWINLLSYKALIASYH